MTMLTDVVWSNFCFPPNDFDVGAGTRSNRRILADDLATLRDHHAAVQLDARVLQQGALRIAQRLAFVPAIARSIRFSYSNKYNVCMWLINLMLKSYTHTRITNNK